MWFADVKPCFLDKTVLVMEEHLCVAGIDELKFWKGFAPVVSTGMFCKLTGVEEGERRWQHVRQVNSLYKDEWQLMADRRRLQSQACWDGLEPRRQLLHTTEPQILRAASERSRNGKYQVSLKSKGARYMKIGYKSFRRNSSTPPLPVPTPSSISEKNGTFTLWGKWLRYAWLQENQTLLKEGWGFPL